MYKKIKKLVWSKKFILLLIIFLALLLRLNVLTYAVFSSPVPSSDAEATIVNTALRLLENKNLNVNLETNNYQPLLIYANALVYAFTFLISLLLGIFRDVTEMKEFFILDRSALVLISRILVGLISTATVYYSYKTTKRLFNETVGLVAAFFFALNLIHIIISHTASVWVPMLLFLILALDQAIVVFQTGRGRAYLLATIFAALSYGSHLVGGMAITPLIAAHFLRQNKILSFKFIFNKRLIFSGALFIVFILLFCVLNPTPLFGELMGGHIMQETGFDSGLFVHEYEFFYYPFKVLFEFHPLLSILALLGIVFLIFQRGWKKVCLILFLPFLYYLYLSLIVYACQLRLFVVLIPFFLMPAAYAIVELAGIIRIKSANLKKVFLVMLIFLAAMPSFYISSSWSFIMRKESTDELAQQWIYENIPENSKILVNHLSGPFYLNPNKEYLLFIKENLGKNVLTQREEFMLNLPQAKYPHPFYFSLKVNSIPKETWSKILEENKFDYYISTYQNVDAPKHEIIQILKGKELIKSFEPGYGPGVEIENISSVSKAPFNILSKIYGNHGSTVKIYKLK